MEPHLHHITVFFIFLIFAALERRFPRLAVTGTSRPLPSRPCWNLAASPISPLLEPLGLSYLSLVGTSRPLPSQPFCGLSHLALVETSQPLPCWNLSASPASPLLEPLGLSHLGLVGTSRPLQPRPCGISRPLLPLSCWNLSVSPISTLLEPRGLSHLAFGTSRPLTSRPCWNLAASPTSPLMVPHHDLCHLEAGSAPL